MAQLDWLLSWQLYSGPVKPPVHMKQSASPVKRQQEEKLIQNLEIHLVKSLYVFGTIVLDSNGFD